MGRIRNWEDIILCFYENMFFYADIENIQRERMNAFSAVDSYKNYLGNEEDKRRAEIKSIYGRASVWNKEREEGYEGKMFEDMVFESVVENAYPGLNEVLEKNYAEMMAEENRITQKMMKKEKLEELLMILPSEGREKMIYSNFSEEMESKDFSEAWEEKAERLYPEMLEEKVEKLYPEMLEEKAEKLYPEMLEEKAEKLYPEMLKEKVETVFSKVSEEKAQTLYLMFPEKMDSGYFEREVGIQVENARERIGYGGLSDEAASAFDRKDEFSYKKVLRSIDKEKIDMLLENEESIDDFYLSERDFTDYIEVFGKEALINKRNEESVADETRYRIKLFEDGNTPWDIEENILTRFIKEKERLGDEKRNEILNVNLKDFNFGENGYDESLEGFYQQANSDCWRMLGEDEKKLSENDTKRILDKVVEGKEEINQRIAFEPMAKENVLNEVDIDAVTDLLTERLCDLMNRGSDGFYM